MAIYYCTAKPLSRSSGRSAVSAAAYRAAARLTDERQGMVHNYAHRSGVLHDEIVLPAGVESALAGDRNALWNAAEAAENRKDARTAREIVIALPHELDEEERVELTRAFAQHLADQYGVAVDVAIHAPSQAGDERNHHAHLLMTTRHIGPDGLGDKSILEKQNAWLKTNGLPTTDQQLAMIRIRWEEVANEALVRAGHDVRIDARSHAECGLQMEPTTHMGVHATAIARRGGDADRRAIDPEASAKNARAVMARPAAVLDIITREKSVFDQRDIARALHRYIADPAAYQTALAKVMACPDLMKLQDEYRGEDGRTIGAKFTTRAMFETERDMAERVDRMAQAKGFAVAADRAIARVEREKGFQFKDEQAAAVHHLAGNARVAAVAGMAGAGKSTMLGAANVAWTTGGHRVFGAALSGKAAEGLEESSSIKSYTLAKWEHQWKQGKMHLQQGDVFVIDEAGMVGSEQMARFVKAADEAGAKLVLVGDAEQLQAINAGAAFRAITDRVGCVDLEVITRQKEAWMQQASVAFGQAKTGEALAAYAEHGAVQFHADKTAAVQAVIRDAVADAIERPEASRIVLAHRNADVRALNEGIRASLKSAGKLRMDATFQTEQGERNFAEGDRIVFLENSAKLSVKNGTLGTVVAAQDGSLTVRVDGRGGAREIAKQYLGQAVNTLTGRTLIDTSKPVFVTVNDQSYAKVAHGYATTIHKSQGATVDRAFVLASTSMDRHLAYVAMTRHKHEAKLYADRGEFADMAALSGRLGRSNAKETTLDYTLRRGLAPASEIVIPPEMVPQPQRRGSDEHAEINARVRQTIEDRLTTARRGGDRVGEVVAAAELQRADELAKAGDLLSREGRKIRRAGDEALAALRAPPEPPAARSAADAIREKFARERAGRADPFKAAAERQRRQSGEGEAVPKQTLEQQLAALKEAGQLLKEREQQKQIDELRRAATRLKEQEQLAAKEAAKEKAQQIREQFKEEHEQDERGMER